MASRVESPDGEQKGVVAPPGATADASVDPTKAPSGTRDLAVPTAEQIADLGSDEHGTYAKITEKILSQSKVADLGEMSSKLAELVAVSKGLNPGTAKHGLLEKAIGVFRNEREQILSHTESVQHRMDAILKELDQLALRQRERLKDLAVLQEENHAYLERLGTNAVRAKEWLSTAEAAAATPPDPADPEAAAKRSASGHRAERLRAAIDDIANAATLAKQQATEIEMTENNGSAILEEFTKTKTLVIPALQSVLAQYLVGLEQKKAVNADAMLRDTLAEAMKQNAQMTGDNAVEIATLQQKSMISVDAIAECQTMLEGATAKIREIEQAGREQRTRNAAQRAEIEKRLLAAANR